MDVRVWQWVFYGVWFSGRFHILRRKLGHPSQVVATNNPVKSVQQFCTVQGVQQVGNHGVRE
jgi:hypothetical protein